MNFCWIENHSLQKWLYSEIFTYLLLSARHCLSTGDSEVENTDSEVENTDTMLAPLKLIFQ